MIRKWMKIDPPERSRTYIFPVFSPLGGHPTMVEMVIENVTAMYVSSTGHHYIESAHPNGKTKRAIIKPGWLAVKIDADDWSFPRHPPEDTVSLDIADLHDGKAVYRIGKGHWETGRIEDIIHFACECLRED